MKQLIAAVLLCISSVAAENFTEDFSASDANTRWKASNESLVMKFENGACSITNSDEQYSSFAFHSLSDAPETFTLTAMVMLTGQESQSAGFICCLASSGMATGYYVSIVRNEQISVDKVGSSGTGSTLVSKRSAFITSGANKLQLSKKDSIFNVFCNDHFVATFTDKEFSKGNIALLVSTKTSAVFDDVSITADLFIEGHDPTCFADNFDDGDLLGWDSFGSEGVEVVNADKAMRISTDKDENIYEVVDLPLSTFVLKVRVSHRGGSTINMYGLFICGQSESTIPVTGFAINGARNFAVFNAGQNIQLTPTTKVKGAAYVDGGDTTWYVDTLEVIKREASAEYLFVVNGDTLSRFTGVSFSVTGAGIFCMDSLTVLADDFLVAQGETGECPVRQVLRTMPLSRFNHTGYVTARRFDLLGRGLPLQGRTVTHGISIVRRTAETRVEVFVK